jgi:hypothetical protein
MRKQTRLSDAELHKRNPRTITDEQLERLKNAMRKYGDLSGLIANLTTGNYIGGNQRVKILGDLPVSIVRRYATPTACGTVAEGVVIYEGERFTYRQVRWSEQQELAAMIAANQHGGEWDMPGLGDLLMQLRDENYEMPLLGFDAKELASMLAESKSGNGRTGDELRTVLLSYDEVQFPIFMERVQLLGEHYGATNVADTVLQAVSDTYARKAAEIADSKQRAES